MLTDYHNNGTNYSWIFTFKTTLDNLGINNIWISQNLLSVNSLSNRKQDEQRQYDEYLQIWKHTISLSSRENTYQLYKERLTLKNYINIYIYIIVIIILKFRTSNHYLPVETGRWNEVLTEDRIRSL